MGEDFQSVFAGGESPLHGKVLTKVDVGSGETGADAVSFALFDLQRIDCTDVLKVLNRMLRDEVEFNGKLR